MNKLVCFCGTHYEFSGDVGCCPECGEYAVLKWPTSVEQREMHEEMAAFLAGLPETHERQQT